MPIDLNKLREDAQKIEAPGRTPPSGTVLEPPSDAAVARRQLQDARGALNAEAAPPGQEPTSDPVEDALRAGQAAGPRGSDRAVGAYFESIVQAANAGDPRVMSQGVVNSETRDRWHEDARQRQMANRDQSGAAHR